MLDTILRKARFTGALTGVMLAGASAAFAAPSIPPDVKAAVEDAARPAEDKQRDGDRKPAEVLAFAGVKKGEHVRELLPGGGYFTRILSKVVGDKGVVYAVVPPPRPGAPMDFSAAAKAIAADPGYKNVKVLALADPQPEPVDLVWTSNNYHDLHNRPDADLMAFNKQVLDALKPGGTYIVIDHAAAAGSGTRDGSTLHRIDPATVKSEVTAAGFEFVGESDALKNAQDPHTAAVFDPKIRGKTDQFVFKFRKPKK